MALCFDNGAAEGTGGKLDIEQANQMITVNSQALHVYGEIKKSLGCDH
jgi:hypothetical protein